jgi:glycosyltransferase involved in cell wall biosynthesis
VTVWIDVSSVLKWERVVGIVRVEVELCSRLLARGHQDFLEFSGPTRIPRIVKAETLAEKIHVLRRLETQPEIFNNAQLEHRTNSKSQPGSIFHLVQKFVFERKRISRFFLMTMLLPFRAGWIFFVSSVGAMKFAGSKLAKDLSREFSFFAGKGREGRPQQGLFENEPTKKHHNNEGCEWGSIIKKGDVLVALGLTWEHMDMVKLEQEKRHHDFKFLGICYDLIPILMPHLVPSFYVPIIRDYLVRLLGVADHIICISKTTQKDLESFAKGLDLLIPPTSVHYLGSTLHSEPHSGSLPRVLLSQPFIIFVSTIEPRKNHQVLYQAYLELSKDAVFQEIPLLVFVGMQGWEVDNLVHFLKNDPRLLDRNGASKILHLSKVNDAELHWLYKNCEFSVYPSTYEGWGLPIAESLGVGTPVLSSDAPSCLEAADGRGLVARSLDPYQWAKEIKRLSTDRDALREARKVAGEYKSATWGRLTTGVLDEVSALGGS